MRSPSRRDVRRPLLPAADRGGRLPLLLRTPATCVHANRPTFTTAQDAFATSGSARRMCARSPSRVFWSAGATTHGARGLRRDPGLADAMVCRRRRCHLWVGCRMRLRPCPRARRCCKSDGCRSGRRGRLMHCGRGAALRSLRPRQYVPGDFNQLLYVRTPSPGGCTPGVEQMFGGLRFLSRLANLHLRPRARPLLRRRCVHAGGVLR